MPLLRYVIFSTPVTHFRRWLVTSQSNRCCRFIFLYSFQTDAPLLQLLQVDPGKVLIESTGVIGQRIKKVTTKLGGCLHFFTVSNMAPGISRECAGEFRCERSYLHYCLLHN